MEAVALSIAMMAPTAAMALNGPPVAAHVGRAVPLAFLIAAVGVLFVAWGFIRLGRHINSAGSVIGLTGATLGPRVGFFAGWALLGTYVCFAAGSVAAIGIFGEATLAELGTARPDWLAIALAGAGGVTLMSHRRIQITTRALLVLEGVSVTLIVLLALTILVKLGTGTAPSAGELTWEVFELPSQVTVAALATAVVFGFLSFGGFEAASTLGEETSDPARAIPAAIGITVVVAGGLYTLVMTAQALGFGATAAGAARFAESSAPLGALSKQYVGTPMAIAVDAGAALSAFAAALAAATGASRLLFVIGRDAVGGGPLARLAGGGVPSPAFNAIMGAGVLVVVALRARGISATDAFVYPATIGVLVLLVAYMLTNLGAFRFLYLTGERRAPRREAWIPLLSLAIVGYVLYRNTNPAELDYPFTIFPLIALGWLLAALVVVLARPAYTRRIGVSLTTVSRDRAT